MLLSHAEIQWFTDSSLTLELSSKPKVITPSATSSPASSTLKSTETFAAGVRLPESHAHRKYFISTSLNESKVSKCHYASRGHQAVGLSSCAPLYCGKVGINLLLHTDVAHVYPSKWCGVVMSSPCRRQTSSYAGQLAHTFISQPVTSFKQLQPLSHIRSDLFKGKWLR